MKYDVYAVSNYDATDHFLMAEGVTEEQAKEISRDHELFDCMYGPMTLVHGASYDVYTEHIYVDMDEDIEMKPDELIAENVSGEEFFKAYQEACHPFAAPHYYVHAA